MERRRDPENMDRISKEMNAEWQEYLKNKAAGKKPSWMIDDNSTYGEVLEFHAVTIPFKYQQLIEIEENAAKRIRDFAKILEDPKKREHWLKRADEAEAHANEMRLKQAGVRKNAARAREELEGLL